VLSTDGTKIINYSFNFKYGEYYTALFTKILGETFLFSNSATEPMHYGHPGLRSLVDYYTTIALSKLGKTIADAGSKYHKIAKLVSGTDK
jgi:hypothetical protein